MELWEVWMGKSKERKKERGEREESVSQAHTQEENGKMGF